MNTDFIYSITTADTHILRNDNHNRTLSPSDALHDAVLPVCEVVAVAPAAAVLERLAPLGLGVESKPSLCTATRSPFHRMEAQIGRTQLCKTQLASVSISVKTIGDV